MKNNSDDDPKIVRNALEESQIFHAFSFKPAVFSPNKISDESQNPRSTIFSSVKRDELVHSRMGLEFTIPKPNN